MTQVVFGLHSTPQRFYQWLLWEHRHRELREVRVKGGKWLLLNCHARPVQNPPGLLHIYYPSAFQEDEMQLFTHVPAPLIHLLVMELAADRIEVTAKCESAVVLPFLHAILARIAATFDESRAQLSAYLGAQPAAHTAGPGQPVLPAPHRPPKRGGRRPGSGTWASSRAFLAELRPALRKLAPRRAITQERAAEALDVTPATLKRYLRAAERDEGVTWAQLVNEAAQ